MLKGPSEESTGARYRVIYKEPQSDGSSRRPGATLGRRWVARTMGVVASIAYRTNGLLTRCRIYLPCSGSELLPAIAARHYNQPS